MSTSAAAHEEPDQPVRDNASEHGLILVPVGQDLPQLWMTKDKEFQSRVIIWDRMKGLNFLLISEQILPPAMTKFTL